MSGYADRLVIAVRGPTNLNERVEAIVYPFNER
jgi:hypothetical protein